MFFNRLFVSIVLFTVIVQLHRCTLTTLYTFFHSVLILAIMETFTKCMQLHRHTILFVVVVAQCMLLWGLKFLKDHNLVLVYMLYLILFHNSVSDFMQYVGGKVLGKRFFVHSPTDVSTKSWEGYFFALFTTTSAMYYIMQWLYSKVYYNHFNDLITWYFVNILGMLGGIGSSWIKRQVGIKDWSNILGAHGGINDRLDSWYLPAALMIGMVYLESQ